MEKSTTMNLRVNPAIKQQAENILKQLGVSMASAVDIYLRQIVLTGGIPFTVALPQAPASVNADRMTTKALHATFHAGAERLEMDCQSRMKMTRFTTIPTEGSKNTSCISPQGSCGGNLYPID